MTTQLETYRATMSRRRVDRGRMIAVRDRAIPLGWAPPLPDVAWIGPGRVYLGLVAEVIVRHCWPCVPMLEAIDRDGLADEFARVLRLVDAVGQLPAAPALRGLCVYGCGLSAAPGDVMCEGCRSGHVVDPDAILDAPAMAGAGAA